MRRTFSSINVIVITPKPTKTPSSTLRLIISSLSPAGTSYPTMAWQRLWRSLERTKEDSKAKTNTSTLKLSDLPPELILLIASMLSTQSAACLSLCNRAMSQILGPNIWPCLNLQNPGMRVSFLSDWSRDLPQYFVCYRCVQLHASSAVQWPRTSPKTLTRCLGKEPSFEHCSQSRLFLRFPISNWQ